MSETVRHKRPLLCIVDDDDSVRESLPDLLGVLGFSTCVFSSGEELFASEERHQADCFILDVAMPGMTGPQIHLKLKRAGVATPVIFLTAYADPPLFPRLMEQGAVACLIKPFSDSALLDALARALAPN